MTEKSDKTEVAIAAASETAQRLMRLENSAKEAADFSERALAVLETNTSAIADLQTRMAKVEAPQVPSTGQRVGVTVAAIATVVLAAVGGGIAGAAIVTRRTNKASAIGGSLPLGDHSTHPPAQGNGPMLN